MAEDNRKVVIELQNVKRYFQVGSETVKALRGVSFKIYEGEFVTIQGTSGSGKSTLLNQLGCLDTPTSGEYFLDGISVRTMSKTKRARLRNRKIGFVFRWLFGFNASELVAFPITALGTVGAALGLIPEMMTKGIIDSNAIAVFTAMGMCWSGFLSADAATLDSLGYRHFISRSFTCTFVGGIAAGIITHWLYFLITYIINSLC